MKTQYGYECFTTRLNLCTFHQSAHAMISIAACLGTVVKATLQILIRRKAVTTGHLQSTTFTLHVCKIYFKTIRFRSSGKQLPT